MVHVIRAIVNHTGYYAFAVFGSQAVLGHFYEKGYDFNYQFNESEEIDITAVPDNPVISDELTTYFGETAQFARTFGYYVDGISMYTPILPNDWTERSLHLEIEGAKIIFPSMEDIAISKYVANRGKDMEFIDLMWKEDLLDGQKMLELVDLLPDNEKCPKVIHDIIREKIKKQISNYQYQEMK